MRVGIFRSHGRSLPSGHRTYQDSLVEGLVRQDRHEVVVLMSERDPALEVPPPHEVVRVSHPRQVFIGAVNFDVHAEVLAARAATRAGVDVMIGNAQWGMPRPRGVRRIAVLYEAVFLEPSPWGVYPAYVFRQMLSAPTRNLRGAEAVVCVSEHARSQIADAFGFDRDRIIVTPPAVHSFGGTPSRTWTHSAPYVLNIGWFHPRKDLPLALSGWRAAVESGMDADLVLGGAEGPPDRVHGSIGRRVLECVGKDLAPRVHFTGSVPRPDLGALYQGCAAVLMTGMHEGFGIPAVEAFSFGKPVVAVARASMPEAVGPVGRVVSPDPAAIGTALADVLTAPPDPAALRSYAAGFTVEAQVAPVLALLDDLSDRAARPRRLRAGGS